MSEKQNSAEQEPQREGFFARHRTGIIGALVLSPIALFLADSTVDYVHDSKEAEPVNAAVRQTLEQQGTRIDLESGKAVIAKKLDFSDEQLRVIKSVGAEGLGKPIVVDAQKAAQSVFEDGPNTDGVVTRDVYVEHLDKQDVKNKDLKAFIGTVGETEDVSVELLYDESREDLILRTYFPEDSSTDSVEFVTVLESAE